MPRVNLVTRIDSDLKEQMKALAKNKKPPTTVSAYVEWLIKEEVERHLEKTSKLKNPTS